MEELVRRVGGRGLFRVSCVDDAAVALGAGCTKCWQWFSCRRWHTRLQHQPLQYLQCPEVVVYLLPWRWTHLWVDAREAAAFGRVPDYLAH